MSSEFENNRGKARPVSNGVRGIVQNGDPVLRARAREIPISDIASKKIQKLIADMKALLSKEEYGVAIAAPQVGESVRLFVVSGHALAKREAKYGDTDENESKTLDEDAVYINPVMTKMSRGKKKKHEGCLSVRGKWGMVPRAEKATLKAYDEHGKKFERGASGLLAHIFQHEMDHLDGILYIDKATELYDDKPENGK
jgi:peptide deformylase